jgi:hypothetical protein
MQYHSSHSISIHCLSHKGQGPAKTMHIDPDNIAQAATTPEGLPLDVPLYVLRGCCSSGRHERLQSAVMVVPHPFYHHNPEYGLMHTHRSKHGTLANCQLTILQGLILTSVHALQRMHFKEKTTSQISLAGMHALTHSLHNMVYSSFAPPRHATKSYTRVQSLYNPQMLCTGWGNAHEHGL